MEQYTASMEKEEQSELNSFLTEIKGTTPIQTGYCVFLLCRRHMQYYYFEQVLLFEFDVQPFHNRDGCRLRRSRRRH